MSESKITKQTIALGFKTLLLKKDFAKVSVSDITTQCGLNRQTFYYHFQDKYELLNWIYYQEAILPAIDGMTFDNWNDKLLCMFEQMQKDSSFYIRTIHDEGSYLQEYLNNLIVTVLTQAVDDLDVDHRLDQQDKQFYAQFYAYGASGSIIRWIYDGMNLTPQALAKQLRQLVDDTEKAAYRMYLQEKEDKK